MAQNRQYSLDVLKFLATSIIIFHHYQLETGFASESLPNWFGGRFYWGYLVELFFLLSGYFAFSSVAKIKTSTEAANYLKRKYMRFLPLLVFCGLLDLLFGYIQVRIGATHELAAGSQFSYTHWGIFASLLGIYRWVSTSLSVNYPTWYVSVLLLCYIVCVIANLIGRKTKLSPTALLLCPIVIGLIMKGLLANGATPVPFFNDSIARGLISFFTGSLVKALADKQPLFTRLPCTIAAISLITFAFAYAKGGHWIGSDFDLYCSVAFIAAPSLLFIFNSQFVQRALSHKCLRNLGAISYSTFMWHLIFIRILMIIAHVTNLPLIGYPQMIAFTCICFLLGAFSTKYLEPNLNNLFSNTHLTS